MMTTTTTTTTRFYNCVNCVAYELPCATSLIFDEAQGTCVREEQASTYARKCEKKKEKEEIEGFSCPDHETLGPHGQVVPSIIVLLWQIKIVSIFLTKSRRPWLIRASPTPWTARSTSPASSENRFRSWAAPRDRSLTRTRFSASCPRRDPKTGKRAEAETVCTVATRKSSGSHF